MAEISIPGVSDRYKTNDLVKSLMEVERIPLKREEAALDKIKNQADAWRRVNQNMSALRDSVRALYSFDNPFSNKTAVSTNEGAVTAVAGRAAADESFRIDVTALASADRFLSGEIEKNSDVAPGTYTYSVADSSATINWKGGKLSDFVAALNKRGSGFVKGTLIGLSGAKQSLLIESLKTGAENRLSFKDAALDFALSTGMLKESWADKPQDATEAAGEVEPGRESEVFYEPVNPASIAGDAALKYEGITVTRPTNTIDDVAPGITLTLLGTTEKSATITITPETQGAKDALITFVGRYNQALSEMNILTQNKGEIIAELEYLTDDERAAAAERLGMFQGDSTLAGAKSSFQNIVSRRFTPEEGASITMLSQLGISTRASASQGYSASALRGYLEIDEKKLDDALKGNMRDIKNLFGYDSDGDMIVDSGLAYDFDQRIQAYTRTNGILSIRANGFDASITASESKIKRLEDQLGDKEARLKQQYGQMESALNNLQSQSDRITSFANQGQRR
jgi:flagellar capping protein FliD